MRRLLALFLSLAFVVLASCGSDITDPTVASVEESSAVATVEQTTVAAVEESTTVAAAQESISVTAGESTAVTAGDVVVHRYDDDVAGSWIGRIVEDRADLGFVLVAEVDEPQAPRPWEPLGLYGVGTVVITQERGSPGMVESKAHLFEVVDARPGEPASVEMVWLGWQGSDPSQYEIRAALEHRMVEGFHLHAECYVVATNEFAVALVDTELRPTLAWQIDECCTEFMPIAVDAVSCEAEIID